MKKELRALLDKIASTASFSGVDSSDVNATNSDGDNGLHCVVGWGDLEAAKLLVAAGVEVNQFGDLGFTPLHLACMKGDFALVEFLISSGADLFAQSEGELPFSIARLYGHDAICEYLAPLVDRHLQADPQAYIKSRIAQLKREIDKLEAKLRT